MNYAQKNNIVSFISSLLVTIPYFFYILNLDSNTGLGASNEVEFLARALLLIIPIRIITQIIIFIIATILEVIITKQEEVDDTTDERDQIIELKAQRNTFQVFTFTIFVALFLLAFGAEPNLALSAFIVGGFISELVWYASTFYYYQK